MVDFTTASVKTCQTCEEDFTPKRSDAKYCSIKCKNALNNHRVRQAEAAHEAIVGETNTKLWRNREILLGHAGQEVKWDHLKADGFDSNYITNFGLVDPENEKSGNLFSVYDISYKFIDSKTIKISNHE